MDHLPNDYSERIKQLRGRLALTQAQLAEMLGVSFATVNRWENQQSRPSQLAWRNLRDLLAATRKTRRKLNRRRQRQHCTSPPNLKPCGRGLGRTTVLRASGQSRLRHRDLADRSAAAPAHRRLRPHAQAGPASVPAGRRCRCRQDDHDRASTSARCWRAGCSSAYPDRRAGRPGRQLAARVGNALQPVGSVWSAAATPETRNPFIGDDSDRVIVSVDTLAGPRVFARLKEAEVVPYDLVSLRRGPQALGESRQTTFTSARPIATGWPRPWRASRASTRVATSVDGASPVAADGHAAHGKGLPVLRLWRLLEPEVLSTSEAFDDYPAERRQLHFIRRTKEEMVHLDGRPLYPQAHL